MYKLRVHASFAAAHHLREYKGKCENVHGHNWKVWVEVKSADVKADGMVIDFNDLKRMTRELLAELDHTDINEHPFFKTVNPTSENIAKFLHDRLAASLAAFDPAVRVAGIAVEEAEGSIAVYEDAG